MTEIRNGLVACALFACVACSHPIEIIGEGDVLSSTGTRDCYSEQKNCNFVIDKAYLEVYRAQPRAGYEFVRWENCLELLGSDCRFNVAEEVVQANALNTAAPLRAFFTESGGAPLALTLAKPPFATAGAQVQFAQDVAYGPGERQQLDLFMPASAEPTALVLFFHEGGFVDGDKALVYDDIRRAHISSFLQSGVAFATANYRYLSDKGLLETFGDVSRALQFLRYHADALNIDAENVAVYGNSAGAGASLWLALNDDMAVPDHADPVLRESTRVKAVAALETQGTYDVVKWQSDVYPVYGLTLQEIANADPGLARRIMDAYSITDIAEVFEPRLKSLRKRLDMLDLMTKDDPGIYVANVAQPASFPASQANLVHHPLHAKVLHDQAQARGVEQVSYIPKLGIDSANGESHVDFLLRKLGE